MPQISKGGKYVFGWSRVGPKGAVPVPPEALEEYGLRPGGRAILASGSRTTGGVTVSTKRLMAGSRLACVLAAHPELAHRRGRAGVPLRFKGRLYAWVAVDRRGSLCLPPHTLAAYGIAPGDRLLVIRGSNVAFVMGLKGPLIDFAARHPGIPLFTGAERRQC
jgi:bifunctional DNA-binding transcriptional regulator/antitoxin component of YhaV-PrlF toxin-antitoxin module